MLPGTLIIGKKFFTVIFFSNDRYIDYEGWNFNNGNYLFTTDTR